MEEKRMPKLTLVEVFIEIANTPKGVERKFHTTDRNINSAVILLKDGGLHLANMNHIYEEDDKFEELL